LIEARALVIETIIGLRIGMLAFCHGC
jgi:hypothetical protein